MNSMSKAREIHQKAALKFNPERLSNFIKFDDEIPIVDKDKMLISKEDESLFSTALNSLFGWDYTTDFNHTTIFFEVGENVIFAGVYDELQHAPITKVPLVTVWDSNRTAKYTYTKDVFVEIRRKLRKPS